MNVAHSFFCALGVWFLCFSDLVRGANSLEQFAPHFSTNTEIVWQAKDKLPTNCWIYKRLPPRPFLGSVISNAMVVASLQERGIPKPSTNDFFIWTPFDCCGMARAILSILPAKTEISFTSTNQNLSIEGLPDDETVKKRAFYYA